MLTIQTRMVIELPHLLHPHLVHEIVKKPGKNPTSLHESNCNSKKFKDCRIYNWDPRPENYRDNVNTKQLNEFIRDLQSIRSTASNQESMWETSFRLTYEDYELD